MKKIITIKPDAPEESSNKGVSFKKFDKSEKPETNVELTEEIVYDALKTVYDPEIPVSIVDLGLIYDVAISSGNNVNLKMTLTTPGCGMGAMIAGQAEEAIRGAGANNVLVEVVWDPPWNPDMMSDEAKNKLGME
ncbi:MAG: iron-sulfur cluster assembly protein [Thermodesulfobacteriota bacterium]